MKHQQGSTLVVALIFLTIITLVSVYSLEGSNIQSKMVANSLFSTLTYQLCRNEQEANIHFYNLDDNRDALIKIQQGLDPDDSVTTPRATINTKYVHEPVLEIDWRYLDSSTGAQGIANNAGNNIDTNTSITAFAFEHDCMASFSFSINSQTLGAKVETLKNTDSMSLGGSASAL